MASYAASGLRGELRSGYQVAAQLGAWSYAHEDNVLTAAMVSQHAFWMAQPPFSVRVFIGAWRWTWPVVTLSQDASSLVIIVDGSPKVERM